MQLAPFRYDKLLRSFQRTNGQTDYGRSEIKMATELLQSISKDEIERARFRSRRMFRMDMEHNLIAARDEGIISVAKNAIDMNMSVETIIKLTGLTREEIECLYDAD